jgi:hypothetical protein
MEESGDIEQSTLIHPIELMYQGGDGRTIRSGSGPAGVASAGGPSAALAAVGRARSQRSDGVRADRSGGPAPEPGLLPSRQAAGRPPGLGPSQLGRPPRRLLHGRPHSGRSAAGRDGRGAPPGAPPHSDGTGRRATRSGDGAGVVPVYGQQRSVPDRRGPGPGTLRWTGRGAQRRQPPQASPSQCSPGDARGARDRPGRPPLEAPERVRPPAVRLGDQPV